MARGRNREPPAFGEIFSPLLPGENGQQRHALVAQWASTPDGWRALVAWTGLHGEAHVDWVDADTLTPMTPERAP